jgi:ssDNA-binding Zn-finger/Zn-ribbon topoisomerase 1
VFPADACPKCGASLEPKNGCRGPFLSCSRYPACKGSRDLPPVAKWVIPVATPAPEAVPGRPPPSPPPQPNHLADPPPGPPRRAVAARRPVEGVPSRRPSHPNPVRVALGAMGLITAFVGLLTVVWPSSPVVVRPVLVMPAPPPTQPTPTEVKAPQVAPAPPTVKPAESPPCPVCGGPMQMRRGKYGPFWGCRKYPACRGTVDVQLPHERP